MVLEFASALICGGFDSHLAPHIFEETGGVVLKDWHVSVDHRDDRSLDFVCKEELCLWSTIRNSRGGEALRQVESVTS